MSRVAFISQGFGRIVPPKADNSVSIWTYETARRLAQNEPVVLIEFGEKPFRKIRVLHDGATYIYLPTTINRVINALHRRLSKLMGWLWTAERRIRRPAFASKWYNLGYVMLAAWQARRWRSEVIHIHNFSQFVPVVRALNPSARIILHMHCEWLSQLDPRMIGKRLESADVVIGCSNYIIAKVERQFPEFKQKCRVVFNGTDVERFVPSEEVVSADSSNAMRILFVGRISPEKGVHVLVEAFKAVAEKFPNARLELVGGAGNLPAEFLVSLSGDSLVKGLEAYYSGDYLARLKSQIPAHLKERITFHGSVGHKELAVHYGAATVFVNSSLSDAFPIPVVEAMAAGLPMAASAVGGIPEAVLHGTTGLLVKPNDREALAVALSSLLGDADLRKRMSAAARERALKLFSWQAIVNQVSRVHKGVVDDEVQVTTGKTGS